MRLFDEFPGTQRAGLVIAMVHNPPCAMQSLSSFVHRISTVPGSLNSPTRQEGGHKV